MSNFLTNIKKSRKLKGITQEAMASKLKLQRNTYAAKETNGNFTEPELRLIAKVLELDYDKLKDGVVGVSEEALLQLLVDVKAMMTVVMSFQCEALAAHTGRPTSFYLNTQREMVMAEAREIWDSIKS